MTKRLSFQMIDVGGQRSERKKWIHCFDDAKAVIFVAALSDYDVILNEDPDLNRMEESIRLFDSVCNNRWFVTACMILFLNKLDIFTKKLTQGSSKISVTFPKYKGGNDYQSAASFFQVSFVTYFSLQQQVICVIFRVNSST